MLVGAAAAVAGAIGSAHRTAAAAPAWPSPQFEAHATSDGFVGLVGCKCDIRRTLHNISTRTVVPGSAHAPFAASQATAIQSERGTNAYIESFNGRRHTEWVNVHQSRRWTTPRSKSSPARRLQSASTAQLARPSETERVRPATSDTTTASCDFPVMAVSFWDQRHHALASKTG